MSHEYLRANRPPHGRVVDFSLNQEPRTDLLRVGDPFFYKMCHGKPVLRDFSDRRLMLIDWAPII